MAPPFSVTVAIGAEGGQPTILRVTFPRHTKWRSVEAGRLVTLLRRADKLNFAAFRKAHLRSILGPLGPFEPVYHHVVAGERLEVCSGDAPRQDWVNVHLWGHLTTPESSLRGLRIISASLGDDHAAVLSDTGFVFTFGANDFGQLGTGDDETRRSSALPVSLLADTPIAEVACGPKYTTAVSRARELFTWGRNQPSNAPTRFHSSWANGFGATPCGTCVEMVACGEEHMGVVSTDGLVWLWGYNEHGQLGTQDPRALSGFQKPSQPLRMNGVVLTGARLLACGRAHTVVVAEDDAIYGCGSNSSGQLGMPARSERHGVVRMAADFSRSTARVHAAGQSTIIVREDGHAVLIGCLEGGGAISVSLGDALPVGGDNGDGSLRQVDDLVLRRLPIPHVVSRVALGASHMLYTDDKGQVHGAGYDRYGQASGEPQQEKAFVHPSQPLPLNPSLYRWEAIRCMCVGGGSSMLVTVSNSSPPSLSHLCLNVLLDGCDETNCLVLLAVAVSTSLTALARKCVHLIDRSPTLTENVDPQLLAEARTLLQSEHIS